MTCLVQAEKLHKRFAHEGQTLDVLRGVDLRVEAGEMLGVVGPSGAGKSTLLHVLGTLERPTSGRLLFDGADITAFSSKKLAEFRNERIGFVFQFHHLLPDFTALENVMMPGLLQGSRRMAKRAKEQHRKTRQAMHSQAMHQQAMHPQAIAQEHVHHQMHDPRSDEGEDGVSTTVPHTPGSEQHESVVRGVSARASREGGDLPLPLKERAMMLLHRVGLAERATHRPSELSGGEQQRVALARALVMEPQLVLADEPTGNLDTATTQSIRELMFSLNEHLGIAFLIVTHSEDLASRMPRVVHMRDGQIERDERRNSPSSLGAVL